MAMEMLSRTQDPLSQAAPGSRRGSFLWGRAKRVMRSSRAPWNDSLAPDSSTQQYWEGSYATSYQELALSNISQEDLLPQGSITSQEVSLPERSMTIYTSSSKKWPSSSTPQGEGLPQRSMTSRRALSSSLSIKVGTSSTLSPSRAVRRDYQVEQRIGRGSCSDVWLCVNKRTGSQHACKVVSKTAPQVLMSPGCLKREADVMMRLSVTEHEGVVRMLGMKRNSSRVEVLTEYCDAGDLFTFLQNSGAMSEVGARVLFAQLASALAFLHEREILHRDIKAENIFLASERYSDGLRAKIGDFRMALMAGNPEHQNHAVQPNFWSAPEVGEGLLCKAQSDVWSLGLVLYSMLTGKLPRRESSEPTWEAQNWQLYSGSVDVSKVKSPLAQDLLRRMLEPSPEKRLTADQLLAHPWLASAWTAPSSVGSQRRSWSSDSLADAQKNTSSFSSSTSDSE